MRGKLAFRPPSPGDAAGRPAVHGLQPHHQFRPILVQDGLAVVIGTTLSTCAQLPFIPIHLVQLISVERWTKDLDAHGHIITNAALLV